MVLKNTENSIVYVIIKLYLLFIYFKYTFIYRVYIDYLQSEPRVLLFQKNFLVIRGFFYT